MSEERFGGTMRCAWSVPRSRPENPIPCPKCRYISGDDWEQCAGTCPMPCSPHYDAECERVFERYPLALVEPPEFKSLEPQEPADPMFRDLFARLKDAPVKAAGVVCGRCGEDLDTCKCTFEEYSKWMDDIMDGVDSDE